jgi:excisionase family DNA binding protein
MRLNVEKLRQRIRIDPHALLLPKEVGDLFLVNPQAVRRWVDEGKLTTVRTGGGHRRYKAREVLALYEQQGGE